MAFRTEQAARAVLQLTYAELQSVAGDIASRLGSESGVSYGFLAGVLDEWARDTVSAARASTDAPSMLRALKAADALLATTDYRDGDVHGIVRAAIKQAEAE